MITLITGLPGAGKTLYALWTIKASIEAENRQRQTSGQPLRQVYYWNIPELSVPGWIEIEDPKLWYELPPLSVLIVDEAQKVFRIRGQGTKVPEYVEQLETHRHGGVDLILLTQHPMLLDTNVRRLAGKHSHVIRAFGFQRATVHHFDGVKDQVEKSRSNSTSSEQFAYPVEAYSWYRSADAHTMKGKVPWRVKLLLVVPVILAGLGWGVYQWWAGHTQREKAAMVLGQGVSEEVQSKVGAGKAGVSAGEYLLSHQARIQGLPHTAPVYDGVTKPSRAPYPAACVKWAGRPCVCYTQQGTRMSTSAQLCQSIVEEGYFVAWEERAERGKDVEEGRRDRPRPDRTSVEAGPVSAVPVTASQE